MLEPGEHTLSIMVTSTDGQIASDVITFTRPPFLMANCSVTGTVLSCDANNEPDTYFCVFDASRVEVCSAVFELQSIDIQVGGHIVVIFIRDIYSQQVQRDLSFNIVSDLQIECQELDSVVTVGAVDCKSDGGIGDVSFNCSIDEGPTEDCKFCSHIPIIDNLLSVCLGCLYNYYCSFS